MINDEEEKNNNKPRKKINKILLNKEAPQKEINSSRKNSEADDPDYLREFLKHSKGAVFITGNETKNNNKSIKKKKIVKKIIKKKIAKNDNCNIINNNLSKPIVKSKTNEEEKNEIMQKYEEKEKKKEERVIKEDESLVKIIGKNHKLEKEKQKENIIIKSKEGKKENINNNTKKIINKKLNEIPNKMILIRNKPIKKNDNQEEEKYNIPSENAYESELLENNKEVKTEYINSKNKNKKINTNLKEKLEKFNYEQNLIIFSKFYNFIQKNFINETINILKIIVIFKKIKEYQNNCVTKISKIYRGYLYRQKLKLDYLTAKILQIREKFALKINSYCKMYLNRIKIKKLIQETKTHYIIYSSLINNKTLYFKYKNENGEKNKLYFEYCPVLKSFILLIDRKEKSNFKIIEGNFFNENNNKLMDSYYETNKKGENIINFTKIFKKADSAKEKNDRIMKRYIKLHRPVKRERIDDYEERKKKAHDDHKLIRSNSLSSKNMGLKTGEMPRSKSFMKLKTKKAKGILKPSKSFLNLRCEEKKIHFGNARIKKYHNTKQ